MIKLIWIIKVSLLSLRRDVRYSILSIIVIAFATMSISTIGIVANSIQSVITTNPNSIGGNFALTNSLSRITEEDLEKLTQLQAKGQFKKLSPITSLPYGYIKSSKSDLTSTYSITGIDKNTYPTVGSITLSSGKELKNIDLNETNAIITSDLAYKLNLTIGAKFNIVSPDIGSPIQLKLIDIVVDTPSKTGAVVFLDLKTAQDIIGDNTYTKILLGDIKDPGDLSLSLQKDGFFVMDYSREDLNSSQQKELSLFAINGLGIIVLLLSGISIINTVRVIMRKRIKELAIIKTLGYTTTEVNLTYLLEIFYSSIIGSLIGILFGALTGNYLVILFAHTVSTLIQPIIQINLLLKIFCVGITSSLAFALLILAPLNLNTPMEIFREQPLKKRSILKQKWIYIFVALTLSLISGLILNNLLVGILVLVGSALFLYILNFSLRLILFVIIRIPIPIHFGMSIANANLKKNISKFTLPFFALIFGITVIGLTIVINDSITSRYSNNSDKPHETHSEGFNIITYSNENNIDDLIKSYGKNSSVYSYSLSKSFNFNNIYIFSRKSTEILEGRPIENPAIDLEFYGKDFGSVKNGVYLPDIYDNNNKSVSYTFGITTVFIDPNVKQQYTKNIGDKFQLISSLGTFDVEVAGFYKNRDNIERIGNYPTGFITDISTFNKLTSGTGTFDIYGLSESPNHLEQLINDSLDLSAFTITKDEYDNSTLSLLKDFTYLAIGLSSITLITAVILLINIIGLSMLERRREIAIMKSIGYTSVQIRNIFIIEFGFIAIISCIVATAVLPLIISIINSSQQTALLVIDWVHILWIILCVLLITLLTITVSSWHDLKIKPMTILRNE